MHYSTTVTCLFTLITFRQMQLSLTSSADVHYMQPGETFNYVPKYRETHFHIFCYPGRPKYIINLWQSVLLQINHSTDTYNQYEGATPDVVQKEFMHNRLAWSFNLFSNKHKSLKLDPFNQSCFGIDSKDSYSVYLNVIRIDMWKLIFLIGGFFLFISADRLSGNTIFYYVCGITFGICASFLILIYFISRMFPRKPFMYGILGCGWTVVIYFIQVLWENLRTILESYKMYVLWYMFASGAISFILIYRWGPVENQRTKNLIRWTLQLLGLALIYFSSQFQEAAMGQIVILIISYNMPRKWLLAPKTYWKRKFPPKVKLLSNDDYYRQGVEETTKALAELRKYCSSPDCNQWKMALKLKDVKRFASFIEGNSHLSDDEVLEYETSMHGELTDDEVEYSEDEY